MPKPRKNSTKSVPRKLHIYCEGIKTEPYYLKGYIANIRDGALRSVVLVQDTNKNTPVQLVAEAISQKNSSSTPDGDEFWVVYDRESTAKYPESLHEKAYNLAMQSDINIALSNVCFEQWILMHFTPSGTSYSCQDDLVSNSTLKKEVIALSGKTYDKASPDIYKLVASKINDAKTHAAIINKNAISAAAPGKNKPHQMNPYTDVPKLLDAIDNFNL